MDIKLYILRLTRPGPEMTQNGYQNERCKQLPRPVPEIAQKGHQNGRFRPLGQPGPAWLILAWAAWAAPANIPVASFGVTHSY